MPTENFDIRFRETGARVIKRKIDEIGLAANSATRGIFLMQRALFVLGGAGVIRMLSRQVDMLTNMENRLRLTASSAENLEAVQKRLFQVARDSRSSFESVADIYNRTALSVRELGTSQAELLRFTESLTKATIISGASSREAHAALIQLGQGMASNTLRGDELRSVLEQLPFVADVIARHLGVTRGELREFGKEGKISAETVLAAFRKAEEEIDELFAQTVPTISQALSVANTNWLEFLDNVDDASSASAKLAKGIIFLSSKVELLAKTSVALGSLIVAIFAGKAVVSAQKYLSSITEIAVKLQSLTEDENLRASSAVKRIKTQQALNAVEATSIKQGIVQLTQSREFLIQQKAEQAIIVSNGRARNSLTGQFVNLQSAQSNLNRTSRALLLTERSLRISSAQLSTLNGIQKASFDSLAAAQIRLAKAQTASLLITAKLIRAFPLLSGVVLATGRAFAALWAFVVANPLLIIVSALTALYLLIEKGKTISEKTAIANEFLSETLDTIRRSSDDAAVGIEGMNSKLVELSRNETIIKLDEAFLTVRDSIHGIAKELDDLSSISFFENAKGITDEMVSGLSRLNEEAKKGNLSFSQLESALNKMIKEFNDPVFSKYVRTLSKSVSETLNAADATQRLLATLNVLNGTASEADRILLGLASAAQAVAGGANAASAAIATLSSMIPELARAAKIQGKIAEAGVALASGKTSILSSVNRGLSLDQAATQIKTLTNLHTRAISEIDGSAKATRRATIEQKRYNQQAELASLTGLSKSLRQAEINYEGIRKRAIEAGSSQEQLNGLAENFKNIQESIKAGASAGGGGGGGGGGKTRKDFATILDGMRQEIELLRLSNSERKIQEEILKIEKSLKRDLTEAEKALAEATVNSLEAARTQAQVLEDIVGPREKSQEQLAALNELYVQGRIGIDDYTQALLRMNSAAEKAAGTFSGGLKASILDSIKTTSEMGSAFGDILVGGVDKAAGAITDFSRTGKFDLREFFTDLYSQIAKLIVKQLLLKSLGFVFGAPVGGGGGGGGGLGSLFGFSAGGSILPSGPGSTDSQVVAFTKRPDERVDILTPGQQSQQRGEKQKENSKSQQYNVTFNITSPDVESFRKSQSQIASSMTRYLASSRRNQ